MANITMKELLEAGVRIHVYREHLMHAKHLSFDDQIVGCDTLILWAERTAARKIGRQKMIARRAASNMKDPRGKLRAERFGTDS